MSQDARQGVFISHIMEEKPVALVLQKYLKLAFGPDVRVFVASDSKSIGGGKQWFSYIIDNLKLSKCYLVLASQESTRREWINFEAGFGVGSVSGPVIPVAIKQFSLGQLSYPLAGFQGRNIDDLGALLDDIGGHLGLAPASIDTSGYLAEIRDAEAKLIYRSVAVRPSLEDPYIFFDIENVGNVDLELLMLEVLVPNDVLNSHWSPAGVSGIELEYKTKDGQNFRWIACYSPRGTYRGYPPLLRPIITPTMGQVRPRLSIMLGLPLSADQLQLSMFFQIHAVGYNTKMEERKLADIK